MKLTQLTVFLENKPGQVSLPCKALAKADINILTLSLSDTQQFGILRLIVRDWRKAKTVLEQAGCVVNLTEVVALEVADRPGGLAALLELIEREGVNIEYMYAFTFGRKEKAVMIFRFDDPDKALELLRLNNVNVLGSVDL
jgi:hypothetical protein